MRALRFITGHMVYNLAYNQILQTKETSNKKDCRNLANRSNSCLVTPSRFYCLSIDAIFETGVYGVPSKSQNLTFLGQEDQANN